MVENELISQKLVMNSMWF